MRSAWLLLTVCACANPADPSDDEIDATPVDAPPPIDGDPCSAPPPSLNASGCAAGSLANLSLDGMWTLTGTINRFGQVMPYTSPIYMQRYGSGPGRCAFALSRMPIVASTRSPDVYINDTIATYSYSATYPHTTNSSWRLCVSDADGSLVYRSHLYVSMPMQDEYVDGVLTR